MQEQVLAEDLGGLVEGLAETDDRCGNLWQIKKPTACHQRCAGLKANRSRKPVTPTKAVRLPPPNAAALAALRPTGTAAAVELRKSRSVAASSLTPDGTPEGVASPGNVGCPDGVTTPDSATAMRTGLGLRTPGLVTASKDPLRSARASPAQLPAGGLNELQAALARRRSGQ